MDGEQESGLTPPDGDIEDSNEPLGAVGAVVVALLLGTMAFVVVNWATNTAGPFGPTTTESGTVVEVDRSTAVGGGGNSNAQRYLTYIEAPDGSVVRFDNVKVSAYAEVGDDVEFARSDWSGRLISVTVEEGTWGQGQDLGLVLRVGFLLILGIVAALVVGGAIGLARAEFPSGLLALPAIAAGGWSGLQWALI